MGKSTELKPRIGPASCPDWALSTTGEIPEWVQIDDLLAVESMLEVTTRPATGKEYAVAFDRLFAFGRTFGLAGGDTAGAVAFYHEALADLPAWALEQTITGTCCNWRWGNRMPLPADLREHVPAAWRLNMARLKRVRWAIAKRSKRLEPAACAVWSEHEAELRTAVGEDVWCSWFAQVIPEFDNGQTLVLAAPSRLIADHIKKAHGETIESIMRRRLEVKPRMWCSKALAARRIVSGAAQRM